MGGHEPDTETLLRILQFSISPAVLVSAVGLLLSPATNRLGRAIDRCRSLTRELSAASTAGRPPLSEQLRITLLRAHRLQRCIVLYGASLFLSCLMVFLLFLKILAGWAVGALVVGTFALDVLALMGGVTWFLLDLTLGLKALDIEVEPHLKQHSRV